jgi:hypothetical protein
MFKAVSGINTFDHLQKVIWYMFDSLHLSCLVLCFTAMIVSIIFMIMVLAIIFVMFLHSGVNFLD